MKFYFDITCDYFGSGLCSNLQVKFVWCLNGWSLWNMLTAEFTDVILQTFYEIKFYVDFRGCVFCLSFHSNIWIDYTCCVYRLSLWVRFTGRVCDPSFYTEFTDHVCECSLLLVFWCWLCKSTLLVNFTSEFMGLTYGHMRWVYKSRLRALFFRSNLMAEFTSQIYRTSFKIEIAVRD